MIGNYSTSPRVISLAVQLLFAAFLPGCLAVNEYLVSAAKPASNDVRVSSIGKFQIGDAIVIVKPSNAVLISAAGEILLPIPIDKTQFEPDDYRYHSAYYDYIPSAKKVAAKYFIVEMLLLTGDERVEINPEKITLSVDNKETQPSGYFELEKRYSSTLGASYITNLCKIPGDKSWSPKNPLSEVTETPAHTAIKFDKHETYCYAIKFKLPPPDPRKQFSIRVGGVMIDGKNVPELEIKFEPNTYTDRHAKILSSLHG
jgi:hypothetical protein